MTDDPAVCPAHANIPDANERYRIGGLRFFHLEAIRGGVGGTGPTGRGFRLRTGSDAAAHPCLAVPLPCPYASWNTMKGWPRTAAVCVAMRWVRASSRAAKAAAFAM